MGTAKSLTNHLSGRTVIITPFLPLKLFNRYLKDPKILQKGGLSLAVADDTVVIRTGMGAKAVSDAISQLKDSGCGNVFFLGSCGGIGTSDMGDLLIAKRGYDTSNNYFKPDKSLFVKLEKSAKAKDIKLKRARIFSTGVLIDEDEKLINELKNQGFAGIELEVAAFYKASESCGLRAAALLYVTDIPLIKPYTSRLSKDDREIITASRDKAVELLMSQADTVLGVNKQNEISRLIYEIQRRENLDISKDDVFRSLKSFSEIKEYLIKRRFPNASKENDFSIYFSKLNPVKRSHEERIYKEPFTPERIIVEDSAKNLPFTTRILKLFPKVSDTFVNKVSDTFRKRDVVISTQGYDFFKACPCSKDVVNCGYHIFNLGFGCPYDCSYCFLQHYTNSPGIRLEANLDDYLDRFDSYLKKLGNRKIRIGTGEFTDSLALDYITEYSKSLVPFFVSRNALLELKTKSTCINNLLGLNHNEKTVISWSLNPQHIVETQEFGAASLKDRLKAAKKCKEHGYKIGFHFDPIIYQKGWETQYEHVVNDMFDAVPDIEWISLGTLRFNRSLKNIIEQRFPDAGYIYEELIIGPDKKMRYYKALRQEIYTKMMGWIRKRDPKANVYLCMEQKEVGTPITI